MRYDLIASSFGANAARLLAGLLLAVAATGCSTMRGTPERFQSADAVVQAIDLSADELAQLAQSTDRAERNRVQNRALAVIDLRFHAFVRDLAADRADSSAAVAGTSLGVSTAGAFVDSVKAKTHYALFGAALVGAFGIVDRSYFYERTVPALVAAMRASRSTVLLRIRQQQQEDTVSYGGVAALQDLEDYYAAGTLLAAIAEITSRAESDTQDALLQVRALEVPTDAELDNRRRVSTAIFAIKDAAAMDKGNAALKALGLLPQSTPKDTRAALVRALQPRTKERIATVEKALKGAGLMD